MYHQTVYQSTDFVNGSLMHIPTLQFRKFYAAIIVILIFGHKNI
jgi:hypothetical protein